MKRIPKLGKICSTSKKALRTQACLHNLKCKPKKMGRAVANGVVKGTVWCCKPKRSLRRTTRVKRRRGFRSHWKRTESGKWGFT